jgi:hypothetical protein
MKKVRNGVGGEVTAEIFETMFPDKPEVLLMDFLNTGQTDIFCVHKLDGDNEYVGVIHLNREYAQKLLDEFKILRGI